MPTKKENKISWDAEKNFETILNRKDAMILRRHLIGILRLLDRCFPGLNLRETDKE